MIRIPACLFSFLLFDFCCSTTWFCPRTLLRLVDLWFLGFSLSGCSRTALRFSSIQFWSWQGCCLRGSSVHASNLPLWHLSTSCHSFFVRLARSEWCLAWTVGSGALFCHFAEVFRIQAQSTSNLHPCIDPLESIRRCHQFSWRAHSRGNETSLIATSQPSSCPVAPGSRAPKMSCSYYGRAYTSLSRFGKSTFSLGATSHTRTSCYSRSGEELRTSLSKTCFITFCRMKYRICFLEFYGWTLHLKKTFFILRTWPNQSTFFAKVCLLNWL